MKYKEIYKYEQYKIGLRDTTGKLESRVRGPRRNGLGTVF